MTRSGSFKTLMPPEKQLIDAALEKLCVSRTFRHGERELVIACLVREADWRPLKAPWWKGKEVCIIGADLDGNFFLRHCDGTVRIWDHQLKKDEVIARSVREFVSGIG
jgi:hypothetical protein